MEKNNSKCMLLQADGLELPIDGSHRRRKKHCVTTVINAVLCLTACLAVIICIVYCSRALTQVAKPIDQWLSQNKPKANRLFMKSPSQNKQQTSKILMKQKETSTERLYRKSDEHKGSTEVFGFESSENTDDEGDWDTEVTSEEEEASYYDELLEDDKEITDDTPPIDNSEEMDSSSGDYSLDDEDEHYRERRSVREKEEVEDKSRQRSRRKPCKGKGCRKEKKNRRGFSPLAAQYEAYVSDEFIVENLPLYDKLQNTDECKYIDKMQGELCRNKLFTPYDPDLPLNIFHPTSWVSNKKSPLKTSEDFSTFTAKSSGIMLVFAQVSFSSNRPTNGVTIIQSRKSQPVVKELRCKQGIPENDVLGEHVKQSCSIVGLLKVEKDDNLQIFADYRGAAIDLSEGSAYFGALQLTKG